MLGYFRYIQVISIFLIFALVQLNAQKSVLDVTFDASYSNMKISDILVDVSKKTKVNISFDPRILEDKNPVSIKVAKVNLGDFLDVLLDKANLEYKLNGKQIIVLEKVIDINSLKPIMKQLSGYIQDEKSKERLPFAYLFTVDGRISCSSNEYGYYHLSIPENIEKLVVNYLGYKDTIVDLEGSTNLLFNISLQNNTLLNEVVIKDKKNRTTIEDYDIHVNASLDKMTKLKSFAGESDIVRYINTFAGVSTGADGLGGYAVRGANVGNNLVLLDGVPVYNTTHGLGVMSVFNESAIKSAQFHKSHIPAQYGGRLASVLDIRTKEGSLMKHGGSINIGLLTAKAYLEGPIIKNKMSFAFSARRTLFEPYVKPVSELVKRGEGIVGNTEYYFYDINAKIQIVANQKNRIYLSYFTGNDKFNDVNMSEESNSNSSTSTFSAYDWKWGNTLYNFRWTSQLNNKTFSHLSLYNSSYNFEAISGRQTKIDSTEFPLFYEVLGNFYRTKITDLGLNWNFDYYANTFNHIKFGISAVRHNFQPGLIADKFTDENIDYEQLIINLQEKFVSPIRKANEFDLFIEDQYAYKRFHANLGARVSLIQSNNVSYYNFQPRIALKTALAKGIYGKISGNITSQFLHLLSSSGIGLPTDIWIPSTSEIRPQIAYQAAGGLDFQISKGLYLTTELYFKRLQHILNLSEGAVFSVIEDENWEKEIPVGEGTAYGAELSLKGQISRHYLDFNYSYGKSTRIFESINSGKPFFSRFDRRHQFKLAYELSINKNVSFVSSFIHATGHPQTLPTNILDNELIYTEKNNQRLPDYQRLDVSFQISNNFKWGSQNITIGVFNALNKKNPYFYFVDYEPTQENSLEFKKITIFPMLPNLSYNLQF